LEIMNATILDVNEKHCPRHVIIAVHVALHSMIASLTASRVKRISPATNAESRETMIGTRQCSEECRIKIWTKKGRTKQVTSSKASVLSVSRKRKRSYPATSDVADQPDSSPPKLAIMVRQAPVHADPRVRVRLVHVYPRGSVVLTSVTLGKKVFQPNMLLHV